jgi:proteic killer suppression protein
VIKSFADRDTEKLRITGRTRHLPGDLWQRALVKPQLIDAAVELAFLKLPPGHHLEALKGNRCGQYSIRINDQWRTCFRWSGTDAERVEIIDYH